MTTSLLITGPPGSGKSRLALERFSSSPDAILLTPTATMAEHVRNQLARAGAAIRPSRILTLAKFLDSRTGPAAAPKAIQHLLIERVLSRGSWPRFAAVASFPGFHKTLADLMEEVPAASLTGPFGEDLQRLFAEVEGELAARGMALRNRRLRAAIGPWPEHVVFDGFFTLSPAELDLVLTIAASSTVTVTLPDRPGAPTERQRLIDGGFTVKTPAGYGRNPRKITFAAPTLEREIEEIARRILEHAAAGRAFRDIGIVVRSRDPYAPALETTLARFGIPARIYFADALAEHPAIAYLSGLVKALLGGWDHADLLRLLRGSVSGIGATAAGDRFDFALRKRLPGAGLPLRVKDVSEAADLLAAIESTCDSKWTRERLPSEDWAGRLKTLRKLLPAPTIFDAASRERTRIWRSTAAALEAFDAALDLTAAALAGDGSMTLGAFWRHADTVLSLEKLRVTDRRRNVVHVLDVFEARQWELPIVFVCGLTERHFPKYHREDPLLNDAARRRAGLETSADLQAQERFLFELATTRPTEELVLSYARFNDRGEPALPSFFLEGTIDGRSPRSRLGADTETCETRVRPKVSSTPRTIEAIPSRSITDAALLDQLSERHKKLAPTSIESFLQCPFQFFGRKTLRLRKRPPAPRDRMDVLLQGSILHRALAEFARHPLFGVTIFDPVFEDECSAAGVLSTYRTEAVRLELRRHFEAFTEDRQMQLGWASRVEEEFTLALNPALAISGRIDRVDVGPGNRALVIDYKYSAGAKIRERVVDTASGDLVQAGLYLLGAVRALGLDPIGMFYCGLKKKVVWDGWHTPLAGLEDIGDSMTAAELQDFVNRAVDKAEETFAAITSGRVAPQPADPKKCNWCEFRDICRVESAPAVRTASAP